MGLNPFKKSGITAATLTLGAAMSALVGKETVTAEEATAANNELVEAGITGAALITPAAYDELEEKAGRTDAAEQRATEADQKVKDLEAQNQQLTNDLAAETERANKLAKAPGANQTSPVRTPGESDVQEPDANQKLVEDLHAKMLGEI
ncbi:hypothetical protein [Hymenobacter sp. B81]|uniref:hypothetical protein n=1 Tax=Hymenobacter sp. B81 TaxID=3344878 RepID=UPI0037DCBA95